MEVASLTSTIRDGAWRGLLMRLIATLLDLYSLIVLGAVIVSWLPIDRRNGLVVTLHRVTEPALAPIRRVLPPMGGLDLSPMVLLIALQVLRRLL
jgi:YggT family protein